jgi:hypothetical protein
MLCKIGILNLQGCKNINKYKIANKTKKLFNITNDDIDNFRIMFIHQWIDVDSGCIWYKDAFVSFKQIK